MIETRRLKNAVIFLQIIVYFFTNKSFVLSGKITELFCSCSSPDAKFS